MLTPRYGLVGPNGHGKTTLLRHIGTKSLQIPPNIDVLYCEQEVIATDDTALQTVLMADVKRIDLLKEEADLLKAQKKGKDVTESLNDVSFCTTSLLLLRDKSPYSPVNI